MDRAELEEARALLRAVRAALAAATALCCGTLWATAAAAQPVDTGAGAATRGLALFRTEAQAAPLRATAERLDAQLPSLLACLRGLEVVARPALDLAAAQLALGCAGEAGCLAQVAETSGADSLLSPGLRAEEGAQGAVVLRLWRFRVEDRSEQAAEARVESTDALAGAAQRLVLELFGESSGCTAPVELPGTGDAAEAQPTDPVPASPPADSFSRTSRRWSLGLAGASGALLVPAIALSVAAKANEGRYADSAITNLEEAERALSYLERGERQATVANVGFALSGAAAASALILWIVQKKRAKRATSHVWGPQLGRKAFGVVLHGRLE